MLPTSINYNTEQEESQSYCIDCSSDNEKWDDIYNYNENQFIDLQKQKQKKKPVFKQRKKWTNKEDDKLRKLVISYGINDWKHLAKKMDGRNPRQCRERWTYYLNPFLKHGDWSYEEDELILKLRNSFGPKWLLISNYFPKRTDAMIKNRYNVLKRIANKKNIFHNEKVFTLFFIEFFFREKYLNMRYFFLIFSFFNISLIIK